MAGSLVLHRALRIGQEVTELLYIILYDIHTQYFMVFSWLMVRSCCINMCDRLPM